MIYFQSSDLSLVWFFALLLGGPVYHLVDPCLPSRWGHLSLRLMGPCALRNENTNVLAKLGAALPPDLVPTSFSAACAF